MEYELIKNSNKSLGGITSSRDAVSRVAAIPATLVFIYLEKLFKDNPDGFYKFQSPSKVASYEPGTSMCEETGWECTTLYHRLNKICTLYKSKRSYLEALEMLGDDGVFCGNPYLRYRDHSSYRVYFRRNPRVVYNIINGVPLTRTYKIPVGKWEGYEGNLSLSL